MNDNKWEKSVSDSEGRRDTSDNICKYNKLFEIPVSGKETIATFPTRR